MFIKSLKSVVFLTKYLVHGPFPPRFSFRYLPAKAVFLHLSLLYSLWLGSDC